jgi:hypothetical protein
MQLGTRQKFCDVPMGSSFSMQYATPWEHRAFDARFLIKTSFIMARDTRGLDFEVRSDREVENVVPPVGDELADWQLLEEAMTNACTDDVEVRARCNWLADSKDSPLRQRIDAYLKKRLAR